MPDTRAPATPGGDARRTRRADGGAQRGLELTLEVADKYFAENDLGNHNSCCMDNPILNRVIPAHK